jgi:hypothetical protein
MTPDQAKNIVATLHSILFVVSLWFFIWWVLKIGDWVLKIGDKLGGK